MMTPEQFAALLEANNEKNNVVLKKEITDGVTAELATFKAEIKTMVTDSLVAANAKISNLEIEIVKKNEEIAILKEDVLKIHNRTLDLEFSSRNKNIVLFRVAENETENKSLLNGVSKMIRDFIDPSFKESDVNEIFRLGKKSDTPRPIMIHLRSNSKRSFLLGQKKKFFEKNVGIAEDLPKDVYEWRKSLYELADTLRNEGKKVSFRRNKLVVDGVELTDENIEEEQKLSRKRGRSPEAGTSTGRRTLPKLNLPPATPKIQAGIEKFYSPIPSSNPRLNKTFEFVSEADQ